MNESCPNCGFDLTDFYKNKIENKIKKELKEKNKKISN